MGLQPLTSNAEIVRVTNISTDTFTITRTQESTSARSIVVGDQIANTITVKTLTDVEYLQDPTDAFWSDGLNAWVSGSTKTMDALDDVNETLSYLAPADASSMNGGTITISGSTTTTYTGRISAGNTNYKGGDAAGATVNYIITDATFKLLSPTIASMFNSADTGTLKYNLNGVQNDLVDLAANFQEANRATTQNNTPWIGGAANLIVPYVSWYNSFPKWQKGTAIIDVVPADLRQGYNYINLVHDGISSTQTTATIDFFYDNDSGSNPTINTPTIAENTPVFRYLSGVKMYDRASTFNLTCSGNYLFNNVYHQTSPLTYSVTNTVIASGTIDFNDASVTGCSNPPVVGETMSVTNKVLTVASSNVRSIDTRFTVTPRDPYTSYTVGTSTSANRLVDGYTTTATTIYEYFDDENRRLPDNDGSAYPDNYDSVPGVITGQWTSATALNNGEAQIYNGSFYYPTINFSTGYLPTGSPNYSAFSGNQVYLRAIYHASTPHSDGSLELGNLVDANVGIVGAGNVNVEIKLPTQTGWLDLGKDYVQATFTGADGDGCQTSQSGDDWGWTCGTFSTSNSGYMYILRITLRNSTNSLTQVRELGTGWA